MHVHPARVAVQISLKISFDRGPRLTTHQNNFQSCVQRFLICRLTHPPAQQYLAICYGSDHVAMQVRFMGMVFIRLRVYRMVRFIPLLIPCDMAIADRKYKIESSHAKMAADCLAIFCDNSDFHQIVSGRHA
jgi:hypothetical protein